MANIYYFLSGEVVWCLELTILKVNTFCKFDSKTKHLSRIRIVRPTAQNIVHNLECVWVVLLSSAVETYLWPIQEIKSENKIVVFAKHQSILKVRNVQNYWQCNKFLTFQIYFNFHGWQVYWNVSWTHVHMCNSYLSKPIIFVSVYINSALKILIDPYLWNNIVIAPEKQNVAISERGCKYVWST